MVRFKFHGREIGSDIKGMPHKVMTDLVTYYAYGSPIRVCH